MPIFSFLIVIFWLFFLAYWLISAASAKRTISRPWSQAYYFRIIIIVILVIFFRFFDVSLGNDVLQSVGIFGFILGSPLLGLIGVIVCALGIAFAIWARVYLGKNWGMPMSVKENRELVIGGPYAYVRHPIYTGFLIAMFGSIFVNGVFWFIAFVVTGIYFIFSAKIEEKMLTKEFPNEYPEYKKRTKMLIPFIF